MQFRVVVLCAVVIVARTQEPRAQTRSDSSDATVMVWHRPIATFRANFESRTPQRRADVAEARIGALPLDAADRPIAIERVTAGDTTGVIVRAEGGVLFFFLPDDIEPGESLERVAEASVERLREALRARAAQQRLDVVLPGIARSAAATLMLAAALLLLRRLGRRVTATLEARETLLSRHHSWIHPEIRRRVAAIQTRTIGAIPWLMLLGLAFTWLTYVLLQFPYTEPWGERLGERILALLARLAGGALAALPGVFVVIVIFFIARIVVGLVTTLFGLAATGAISIRGVHPDTALATQRLVVLMVWGLAAVAAYPYIPGSQSEAFTGISLLIGLVASLGSMGIAGQVMSGFSVVYSRALRPDEFVRVGDVEGQVRTVGLLATKIATVQHEEVTVPNSVLITATTVNFSRLAEHGVVVSTSVGIGYDTPWRQVHGLLVLAATRTEGVRQEPAPRVVQRALRSFDIEYVLYAHVVEGRSRPAVLSELNAQVQDAFNEYGVQIMTPAFEGQPDKQMTVPKARWYEAPAMPSSSGPRAFQKGA